MYTVLNTLLAIVQGDWFAAAFEFALSILGIIYLTARYGWRYAAPALILTGVALCRLALDMAGRPLIIARIGTEITVLVVCAALLLAVLGDIGLWGMLSAPPPPKDYPPLFGWILLPILALIPLHEADNVTGFVSLVDSALWFVGLLAPACITVFQVMRAIRAAKRAHPTP